MLISRCWLAPHLPTLLVDHHRGHRTPMVQALTREGERLRAEQPEAVVVLSTRWRSKGPFHVDTGRRHRTLTDYENLGVEVRYDCPGHPALAAALVEAGTRAGVHVGPAQRGVDSGVSVPMHFLAPARTLPLVPLSVADRGPSECRAWGAVIRRILAARPERVALVVGGMLSRAEHAWTFRREVPEAAVLDEQVLEALSHGAWDLIRVGDAKWARKAQPDADLAHLEVLRGYLDGDLAGTVLCYDPEPGMGSALVAFDLPDVESLAGASAEAVQDWRRVRAVDRRGLPPRRESFPPSGSGRGERAAGGRSASGERRRPGPKRREAARPGAKRREAARPGVKRREAARPGVKRREAARPGASSRRKAAPGRPSAASRTPRARGRPPGSRPDRKRSG